MRITNKIMQNNSLYNINNNKVTEDQLNTMMSTGKKITRPSDDPVIAIRALRLRSTVAQLQQYYEKNAKDAESWLEVTADAMSNVTSVLTDCVKQATKGANKDLTLDDLTTIITQMDSLAKEYYSTGNVDYAGRYIFTGYRTDTPLTFEEPTTSNYEDINDEFRAENVSDSKRILGKYRLDSSTALDETTDQDEIIERSVGRIRLSYDNLDYVKNDGKGAVLKYREALDQPATSSIADTVTTINLTFKDVDGITRYACVPVNSPATNIEIESDGIKYNASRAKDGRYVIEGTKLVTGDEYLIYVNEDGTFDEGNGNVDSAITKLDSRAVATVKYTSKDFKESLNLPLLPSIDQTYDIKLDGGNFTATVNSDGTFTVRNDSNKYNLDDTYSNEVIQVTANGSVHSSYLETSFEIEPGYVIYSTTSQQDIDKAYEDLYKKPTGAHAYLNADTGEVLLNEELKNKLSALPDVINANSIDVIYDKKEWVNGDIRPENLFACSHTDENGKKILYNKGSAGHDIAYDVGFAQSVVVNTTSDAVFSTDVKRDISDLQRMLADLKAVDSTIKTLKQKRDSDGNADNKKTYEREIAASQKAYDYLREEIQKEFEHKITSMQKALDVANIAVTDNGTRSKRLDLISSRLMGQTTTFRALQSENEDIDLAEAATKLTTAQVTYEASLRATGKISQTNLMNFI